MTEISYLKQTLMEGRSRRLRDLADLARDKDEAARIVADIEDFNRQLGIEEDNPAGLDYRDDDQIWKAIVRYLEHKNRPATQGELAAELIRGRFLGYRNGLRDMDVRVGRCIRAYIKGRPKENPKLKVIDALVGLPVWDDSLFV